MNNAIIPGLTQTLNEGLIIKFDKEQLILIGIYFIVLLFLFALIFQWVKSAF